MKPLIITPDHWISTATRIPYPAGPEMSLRRFVVNHFTDGAGARSSADFWKTPEAKGAEAHVIIDRDGTIYQIRPFNQRCDHAGESSWTCPRTKQRFTFLNSCSIGVELANGGFDDPEKDGFDWAKNNFPGFKSARATHRLERRERLWECFYPEQIEACIAVNQAVIKRYSLDDMVGHDDIAPSRKLDPGPLFPWRQVREACNPLLPPQARR